MGNIFTMCCQGIQPASLFDILLTDFYGESKRSATDNL
uniref:Uncharacterized protein n=1 Tax=Anguilla anguilla TaxID=7936 RepID=A0A0E9VXK8_ANGAN